MAQRVFIERGACMVWISIRDGKLQLSGQDLSGFMGTSEYEYFVTVESAHFPALRQALGVPDDADLIDAMCARADEIFTAGETTWLENHGVPHGLANWHHFDD